jgi:hypothetical protein
MRCEKFCVAVAVLLTCTLPGRSRDDKPADQPKREITATRQDDGSIQFRFTLPATQGDAEFAGVELLRWRKGAGTPDVTIYIPLKATLDTEKRAYSGSFTLTKEMIDLDLAISTMYRSKGAGRGAVERLADIPVRPAKNK